MSCFACLRVDLPAVWAQKFEQIRAPLVKIVDVYLETRWSWPRRFSRLTDLMYLLEAPGAAQLDPSELCRLVDQLQVHLFGKEERGEISLLFFEGPSQAVAAFAAFSPGDMLAAIADPDLLPAGGTLTRVRPGAAPVVEGCGPRLHSPAPIHTSSRLDVGLSGTYFLAREVFAADLLVAAPEGAPYYYATVEGEGALPPDEAFFDEICFRAAGDMLMRKAGGLPLGVPVAYSHLVRSAQVRQLERMLTLLPQERRKELNASVYGVPRRLTAGLAHLHQLLDPYFVTVNLVTSDAAFDLEQVVGQKIGCIVLCVREADASARKAAIQAFAARQETYRRHGVRQVLANLRTAHELKLAARFGFQLVSGPAVSSFHDEPMGGKSVPFSHLPLPGRHTPPYLEVS